MATLTKLKVGGEFNLLEANLILSTGLHVDLRASIISLTIFEGLNQLAITGNMLIQDAVNLASIGPILGQEYLKLKIATPSLDDTDFIIDYSENALMVTSLDKRDRISDTGVQVSVLSFVSREFVMNQRTRVRRSLTGTYSEIVETMLRKDLDSTKRFFIESSVDNKKIIPSNISPFDVINLAAKHAISVSDNDATYMFWENTRGFNFRTLGNMYSIGPKMIYEYTLPGTRTPGGVRNIIQELRTIEEYTISGAPDTIYNYTTGVYGSELIAHDIISKSYQKTTYNYVNSFNRERHIDLREARPLANTHSFTQDEKNVSSFPAKQYLVPTTGIGTDNSYDDNFYQFSFTTNRVSKIQSRNSQMAILESGLSMSINVVGTTIVSAGDIIEVRIPHMAVYKKDNETLDPLYNGNFLVRNLRHDFIVADNKHKISMGIVKDSMNRNFAVPGGNFEPKSSKTSTTIRV